jgi:hypothetical protein
MRAGHHLHRLRLRRIAGDDHRAACDHERWFRTLPASASPIASSICRSSTLRRELLSEAELRTLGSSNTPRPTWFAGCTPSAFA